MEEGRARNRPTMANDRDRGEKLNYHKEIASEYSIRRSIECRRVDEKASIGFPISPAARARDFCIGNFKNQGYPRILGRRSFLSRRKAWARACWFSFVRKGGGGKREELKREKKNWPGSSLFEPFRDASRSSNRLSMGGKIRGEGARGES